MATAALIRVALSQRATRDLTQFDFNFERKEVYECGAALLAVLACPGAIDGEKSSELYRSLCGKALWRRHLENPNDRTPITVKPQYVFRDRKAIQRDVAYVAKRLSERMVAGRMAIAFFQQAALGQLKPLPKGIQRLSVNQMAEFVLDDAEQADAGNVERRMWAPIFGSLDVTGSFAEMPATKRRMSS